MLAAMQRALVAIVGLTGACGFQANEAPGNARDAGLDAREPRDAAVDAVPDAATTQPARRRKKITFDGTKVTEPQKDFPAWIELDDAEIAARAQADGRDIYFTSEDGKATLDHELQLVDRPNHRFAAWVRIPNLTSTTAIYVNYGDPIGAPGAKPADVFKASFAAVWHLDDANPATAIADATGQRAGTPHLTAATTRATARLGSGLAFTGGANDRVEFTNPLSGSNVHTISAWVALPNNLNHTASIIAMGTPEGGKARWLHGHYAQTGQTSLAAGFYQPDFFPSPSENLDGAGLTYVVWVFEGGNKRNHLYRNGVEIAAGTFTANGNAINTQGNDGSFGYAPAPNYGPNNAFEGTIDELRIATVVRSASWIATEYANQRADAQFFTVGPELMP